MNTLETDRLIIRKFSPTDWKDLYECLSNEEVVRYEPYNVQSEDECIEEAYLRSNEDAFWAVCLKDSNKLIGTIYFQRQEPLEFFTWELGYVFNILYHKNGYATESCAKILEYGFNNLNARRIVAMCNPLNVPSWRLLERLNLRREGHLKQNIFFKYDDEGNPIWNDTYEYGILKHEWTN